ncbi:alpha/beta fold hydrolase [Nocardia higoensis]|uniref:Alpha/beta fold hydrolase n=1 Tax=Nocardia higoensis TaxID=228599 RepID=A0ABS0DEA0_9NOCA|nr:alpha/beta fold hydrolase [Nocardia higoensis]MBF6356775.1 alpha/beta fold hydrolase [Nocardia higoensis]
MTGTAVDTVFTPRDRVHRDGVALAVFECGDPKGVPVLLIHGWPDTHLLWAEVAARLAPGLRVIAFDNRGAGDSSAPNSVADYRLEELADDVFAVLDAVAPGQRVHVLGHDWGSVLGWEVAADPRAPKRIASFTALSGPNLDFLGAYLRGPFSLARLRGTLEQGIASAYTVAFQIPGMSEPVLRLLARRWPKFLAYFDGLDADRVSPAPTLLVDMLTGLALYRANIRPRMRDPRPRPIEIPVQLLVASGDRAVRPVVNSEASRWVRDLTTTVFDARHWSPISHPEEVAGRFAAYVAARADEAHAVPAGDACAGSDGSDGQG